MSYSPQVDHSTLEPHSGQNFAPATSVAPHLAHVAAVGVPHSGQNFAPAGMAAPHLTHFAAAGAADAPHSGQNFAPTGIGLPHLVGGQMSKSTPMGAVAKFAASGKVLPKKDLGMMAMTYGNIYVAQIAMGANQQQAVKAIAEAEAFDGPSLIIAYAHCINHGINMVNGLDEQKKAVACGRWILYRYNPALKEQGKNPLAIDSKPDGKTTLEEYMAGENRFKQLTKLDPAKAKELLAKAEKEYEYKRTLYAALAERK